MKIITTVGTSVFDNYQRNNESDSGFRNYYKVLKNLKYDNWDNHKSRRGKLEKKVKNWYHSNENASAEIKSIFAIAQKAENVNVHLIATDTVLSVLAAELIKEWFSNQTKINILFEHPKKLETQPNSNHIIHKLRITSNEDYQEGFMNLIGVVTDLIDNNKNAEKEIILNITGGYKAIVPIFTLIGQLENVPLKYIGQESDLSKDSQLVEIGNLPFNFDWQQAEIYHYYLQSDILKKLPNNSKILERLRDLRLVRKSAKKQSILGTLLFKYIDNMPDSGGVFGYIFEQKVFEYFVRVKSIIPEMNKTYFVHKDNKEIILESVPKEEKGKNTYLRVEIDLLYQKQGKWVIMECKSYGKIKDKLIKSIENAVHVVKSKIGTPSKVILMIHKYEFHNTNAKKQVFKNLRNKCSLPIEFFTVDIPINLEQADINYMKFMQQSNLDIQSIRI